jgi:hypothetical protein
MQISRLPAARITGPAGDDFPGGVSAATAALQAPADGSRLGHQLKAYHALASRWREAGHGERAALAQALTASPFAQGVQSTLNAFTRAAWAGPDAAPPAPQAQILKAFDALSETDRQIVAAMHVDPSGAPAFASADDYRARLHSELEAAQAAAGTARRPDTVTLSDEAQARLAQGASPEAAAILSPAAETAARPELTKAIAAYAKAAR